MQHTIRKNSCDSKEHKYNYATHTTCQSVLTSLDNLLFVYVEEKGQGIIMMVMLIFGTHDIGPNTNLATYEKERGGIASVFQEFWHQGENTRSHDCWCVCKIHIIEEVEVMKLEDNFIYPGSIKGLEEKIYVQYVNWCHHHCQAGCVSLVHPPFHPGSGGLTGPFLHPGNCILLKTSSAYYSALYSALMSRAVHCRRKGAVRLWVCKRCILCSAYFIPGEVQCSQLH